MSGVRLTGDWKRLDRALKGLADPYHFTRMHKRIAEHGVSSTLERFRTERDPQGRRWIPSARVLERGGQTLTDTARLRKSITGRGGPDKAEWGTNVVYAARHNFGDQIARGRRSGGMPQRQFIGLNQEDLAEIQAIVAETLAETGLNK